MAAQKPTQDPWVIIPRIQRMKILYGETPAQPNTYLHLISVNVVKRFGLDDTQVFCCFFPNYHLQYFYKNFKIYFYPQIQNIINSTNLIELPDPEEKLGIQRYLLKQCYQRNQIVSTWQTIQSIDNLLSNWNQFGCKCYLKIAGIYRRYQGIVNQRTNNILVRFNKLYAASMTDHPNLGLAIGYIKLHYNPWSKSLQQGQVFLFNFKDHPKLIRLVKTFAFTYCNNYQLREHGMDSISNIMEHDEGHMKPFMNEFFRQMSFDMTILNQDQRGKYFCEMMTGQWIPSLFVIPYKKYHNTFHYWDEEDIDQYGCPAKRFVQIFVQIHLEKYKIYLRNNPNDINHALVNPFTFDWQPTD